MNTSNYHPILFFDNLPIFLAFSSIHNNFARKVVLQTISLWIFVCCLSTNSYIQPTDEKDSLPQKDSCPPNVHQSI